MSVPEIANTIDSPYVWLVGLVIAMTILNSAWLKGVIGEFKLRTLMLIILSWKDYFDLHDVTLRTPDGTTQIDHILVSRYGVFVIETKNYSGWIYGSESQRLWTQTFRRRKYTFMNPLRQNYKHVQAVRQHTGLSRRQIHSVVVFVGSAKFKSQFPPNVTKLSNFSSYLKSKSTMLLTAEQVERSAKKLTRAKMGFISKLLSRFWRQSPSKESKPICPQCGRKMVRRTAKKGQYQGTEFWGCSGFPSCTATKQII